MKNYILLASGAFVLLATTTGLGTAIFASSPELIARATTVASILGLASIGLFFVGLAFPKAEAVRVQSNDGNQKGQ